MAPVYGEGAEGDLSLYNDRVTVLLRSITFFTAIALLLFVGLHAVVPHDHPHVGSFHGSEVPPIAHADNKFFFIIVIALLAPLFSDALSRIGVSASRMVTFIGMQRKIAVEMIPIRYQEALRKGRIHSRAH